MSLQHKDRRLDFQTANRLFQNDRINELFGSRTGLRFLKLRSLSRKAHLEQLFAKASAKPLTSSATDMLREAFGRTDIDDDAIENTILSIYESERGERRMKEDELVNQLYRLQVFDWGGLHQNSLERNIVNNYVKKIRDYEELSDSIENELSYSLRGYVLCSWYNHWTSIIIEDIFRDHPNVLPAVGLIKKIDFFVTDIPFDLKVTYLPEGYVKTRRRALSLRPEITLFKKWARGLGIPFNAKDAEGKLLPDLWAKASDHPSESAQDLIRESFETRKKIVQEIRNDPLDLIRWLYENQGTARFDASNRLFLVLIDPSNFFESWKLKRAKALLESNITRHLDGVLSRPGKDITFNWQGSTYSALSDVIVVTKPVAENGFQQTF